MRTRVEEGTIVEFSQEPLRGETSADGNALAARADAQRRAGDAEAALRLAREAVLHEPTCLAGHAAVSLALLDLGRDAELRHHLAALIVDAPDDAGDALELVELEDGELESAFESASPEPDAMHDANEVAFEAMRAAQLLGPEGADPAAPGSPFHTRTMATLLERQGDRDAAQAIRASLGDEGAASRSGRRKDDVLRTLERWLGRLR